MAKKPVERALQRYLRDGRFHDVPKERAELMRSIRSRGNKTTEARLRLALVRAGISGWQMHRADFNGTPDFLFDREGLAIFVDGCYWHGCPKCKSDPKTNQAFWRAKFARNAARDRTTTARLRRSGISVIRLWEHELGEDLGDCVQRILRRLVKRRRLPAQNA